MNDKADEVESAASEVQSLVDGYEEPEREEGQSDDDYEQAKRDALDEPINEADSQRGDAQNIPV